MTKKQFLINHNKLSPPDLQATLPILSRFKIEKSGLFKNSDWSIDLIRRPFILWLTALTTKERKILNRNN